MPAFHSRLPRQCCSPMQQTLHAVCLDIRGMSSSLCILVSFFRLLQCSSIHCIDESPVPFSTSQGLTYISYSTLTIFCIQEIVLRSYVLTYTD